MGSRSVSKMFFLCSLPPIESITMMHFLNVISCMNFGWGAGLSTFWLNGISRIINIAARTCHLPDSTSVNASVSLTPCHCLSIFPFEVSPNLPQQIFVTVTDHVPVFNRFFSLRFLSMTTRFPHHHQKHRAASVNGRN